MNQFDLEIICIPSEYKGETGKPLEGVFSGIRKADNIQGMLILDFATPNGSLPLYAHGTMSDSITVIRNDSLSELGVSNRDLGKTFIVTPGQHKKKNGNPGKTCVIAIERKAPTKETETEPGPSKPATDTRKTRERKTS